MITEIIGRFHPIVVHLPIGVFTLTFFMRYVYPRVGMTGSSFFHIALLSSFVSSIAAVFPGWLLSLSGDYNTDTIGIHQWSAVALTILIGLLYWMEKWRGYLSHPFLYHALFVFSMGLLIVVGHAGGTLTHGEGYLFPDSDTASSVRGSSYTNEEPVADTASASVYTALVDPLLHTKCQSCHRSKKIKGGLRMDGYEWILKGGKNGKILVSGDPASSELIRRIHLPIDEEKHMPPKGKNQLTEKEMALLHWWIAHGASASLLLKEVARNDTIKPFLASISVAKQEEPVLSPKNPADSTLLANIKALGFTARPIAIGSGWLEVSAVNMASVKQEDLKKLLPLADHILWLNLSGHDLAEMQLDFLRSCIHIQKLNLSNTGISDAVATHLKKLPALTYLNVVGTFFSDKGLVEVCDMKSLRQLYGWKTKITQSSLGNVYKKNPRLKIDLGAQ